MIRYVVVALLAAALACASHRRVGDLPEGSGPLVGIYKATFDDAGTVRRAKVSVWAEWPDRLHAEISGPVGGVAYVVDSGSGTVCIVDTEAATAFVGLDDAEAIASVVGVRLSAASVVAALLSGISPPGSTVSRDGPAGRALPERVRIEEGRRSLDLALLRLERAGADPASLGTGEPPARLPVRPLESLTPR